MPEGRRFRLLMVGDGDGRGEMMRAAEAAAPGRVAFLGHRDSPAELAKLLAACDVFVHPNPREPFGIGPLEAMAAGIPLVAPSSGGVLSYASPDNAYLAVPSASAFAEAIVAASSNGPIREAKLSRARETALQHQWRRAAARYLDLYAWLYSGSVPGAAAVPDLEPAFVSTRNRRNAWLHDALS